MIDIYLFNLLNLKYTNGPSNVHLNSYVNNPI